MRVFKWLVAASMILSVPAMAANAEYSKENVAKVDCDKRCLMLILNQVLDAIGDNSAAGLPIAQNAKITSDLEKYKALIPQANQLGETHLARVCQIVKANGWPEKNALQNDGFDAFTFLISNSKAFDLQRELLPVLIQAAKSEYIGFPFVASMVDSIRLQAGLPQIFGTQATIKNDIVYLYPLLNDEKVDEWRKEYQLPPLAAQIRRLEAQYMMPVLKSQRKSSPANAQAVSGHLTNFSLTDFARGLASRVARASRARRSASAASPAAASAAA